LQGITGDHALESGDAAAVEGRSFLGFQRAQRLSRRPRLAVDTRRNQAVPVAEPVEALVVVADEAPDARRQAELARQPVAPVRFPP
jgi:hypothetical protein